MKMQKPLSVTLLALAFAGCRTNKDILNDYERDFTVGNYEHAAVEVSEKAQETGVDQLLWQLQAGGAQHLAANGEQAIAHFDRAEDIFIDNDATSVFSKGASGAYAMMTNDRVFPFAGTGQDRIFTCLYKAIDYATANRVDAVRTELNRAAQHQENWIYERRKDIVAARERLQKDSAAYAKENKTEASSGDATVKKAFADPTFAGRLKANGFDPSKDGDLELLSQKDYMNVYVQHVCGVFRWLTDGSSSARDYFKGLPDLAPANAMLKTDLCEAEAGTKPQNQVWIYVEDGLCPCREEWRLDLPLILIPGLNRYVQYAGMAVPVLRYRSAGCASYAVADGTADRPMELLQDMDRLLKVEHDVYMRGALTREITRVVVKAGVQIALGVTAENCNDSSTRTALKWSQLAAAAWAASVTQADLRSWTALPKSVYAVRLTRPADGKVVLKGNGAALVTFDVPAGNSVVFVNKPAPAAAPVVRITRF